MSLIAKSGNDSELLQSNPIITSTSALGADNNVSSEESSDCSSSTCNSDSESSSTTETSTSNSRRSSRNDLDSHRYPLKMFNFCKDLSLFIFMAGVTYAVLINDSPPKVTKGPAAYPFFSKNSTVSDWYKGDLSAAIESARSSDIAFVMFYAPWDADSQHARKQFEIASQLMADFVAFAAVNCWHPTGECKNRYNKVYGWPVLIAYPTHGRGIQYNGPLIAEYMVKFLLNICWPLQRQSANNQLPNEDAYVTVDLNALPGSMDYAVYYSTALKYIEKDPLMSVKFYVNPEPADLAVLPNLRLHLWNETLIYPVHENEWRPDVLLKWIMKHLHQVSKWIAPLGSKSVLFSNSISSGPSLILFTPRNPLADYNDYFSLLQEIAREYNSCDGIKTDLNRINRLEKRNTYETLKKVCNSQKISFTTTTTISPSFWSNISKDCSKNICDEYFEIALNSCNRKVDDYFPYKTSMIVDQFDWKSPKNLAVFMQREQCRQFLMMENYHKAIFEQQANQFESNESLAGLKCKGNQSLNFLVLDSLNYYHFAEKLGVDLFKKFDKSAVVIVNHKMETHHILQQTITTNNLRSLIRNFTLNHLKRSSKSIRSVNSVKSHSYPMQECEESDRFCILELNSNTFITTIMQSNKAVVVFYYSKQCSFCQGISYAFITVAKKFSLVKNLQFARIDGDLNILPWEFTMEKFPTILFFPETRKEDSVAFPRTLKLNISNLLGFVLTNLEENNKLHALWSICKPLHKIIHFEDYECIKRLRIETLSIIEKTLRLWRISNERQKQILLYKLKQLKHLHLLFAHAPMEFQSIQNYLTQLNSESNFSRDYVL